MMIMLKIVEVVHRQTCREELLKNLVDLGYRTDGSEGSMELILGEKGFGLPVAHGDHFGFIVNHTYTRLYLNYSDALAKEILFLHELELI
jgi:hypothetical protein